MVSNLCLCSTTEVKRFVKTAITMGLFATSRSNISESPLCLYARNRNEPALSTEDD
jgi:hypothetical protein